MPGLKGERGDRGAPVSFVRKFDKENFFKLVELSFVIKGLPGVVSNTNLAVREGEKGERGEIGVTGLQGLRGERVRIFLNHVKMLFQK